MQLPDVTLRTLQGDPLPLRVSPPAPRLLLFYRHECPTCALVLPVVERISRPLHARGLETIGVSLSDAGATLDAINEHGLCFPQALDAGRELADALDVRVVPSLLLFGADHELADGTRDLDCAALTRVARAAARAAGADEDAIERAIAAFDLPDAQAGSPARSA